MSQPYLRTSIDKLWIYEFGAGTDLVMPLTRAALGVRNQLIVDHDAILRPRLVIDAIAKLRQHAKSLGIDGLRALRAVTRRGLIDELRDTLGIEYRAPFDSTATRLSAGSFDLVLSNSTLEHVPAEALRPLTLECCRLLSDSGVMCFRIDYEDHYAIGDDSISPYNFLRFDEKEWQRFNSRLHFQNRLRHRDYVELFADAELEVLRAEPLQPSLGALSDLAAMPLAESFRGYALEELAIRKGVFVLRRRR